ncbi:MAG: nucleoside triphosphate pyrophosphohydrolase [Spirochaetota bacterium]
MNNSETYYFERFWQTLRTLRGPYGCPWDREQTSESIKSNLIEEAYECLDSINSGDSENFLEELGDVFLVAMLMICIEQQAGTFTLADVFRVAGDKLIRRHPHVFGDTVYGALDSAEAVKGQWEDIKANVEGRGDKNSVLDTIPKSLPPLEKAAKLQKKAAKHGFDWPDVAGAREKLAEELQELDEAYAGGDNASIESELGDVLFSVINLARKMGVNAGESLHAVNNRFSHRFRSIEKNMRQKGSPMGPENLEIMEEYWQEAKNGQ